MTDLKLVGAEQVESKPCVTTHRPLCHDQGLKVYQHAVVEGDPPDDFCEFTIQTTVLLPLPNGQVANRIEDVPIKGAKTITEAFAMAVDAAQGEFEAIKQRLVDEINRQKRQIVVAKSNGEAEMDLHQMRFKKHRRQSR